MKYLFSKCSSPFWAITHIASSLPFNDCVPVAMQARHGKKKRLEETLNTGFDINAEDSMGNTLLLVAVQNIQVLTSGSRASMLYC